MNFSITCMVAPCSGTYFITTFTKASRPQTSSFKKSMRRLPCLINTIHFLSFLDSVCSAIIILQAQRLGLTIYELYGFVSQHLSKRKNSPINISMFLQPAVLLCPHRPVWLRLILSLTLNVMVEL